MNIIFWQSATVGLATALGLCLYLAYRLKISLDASLHREEKACIELLDYPTLNPHPVFRLNKMGMVIYANPASAPILRAWGTKLNEKIPAQWRETFRQVLISGRQQTIEVMSNEKYYLLEAVPMGQGNIAIFGRDITARKQVEKELELRATRDEITQLPNRIIFLQNLRLEMNHAKASRRKFGILIVRLDDYFEILNSYNEVSVNKFVQNFSQRLKNLKETEITIARLSENEFGLIAPEIHDPSAMASFASEIIDKGTQPYQLNQQDVFVTLSIGIAFYPGDGEEPEILARNAQLAVNRTSSTRNQYEFFQRGMIDQLQVKRNIIADLHKALEKEQLLVYYQPQIHLRSRQLVSCEALIRWNHPEKGFISPFFFMTAAEETKLIVPIGEWVLRQACQQIVRWREEGKPFIKVAVNISARQLFQSDFVATVKKVIAETKMPVECLELELTESALVQNMDKAIEVMKDLKKIGVELALDDFGTGYSSLSYLLQFPVDKLKIDRSFVKVLDEEGVSKKRHALVKGIIELAHSLNIQTVAEGVETKAQLLYLKENKCDFIQGYYFSPPQPPEKFIDFFKTSWKT